MTSKKFKLTSKKPRPPGLIWLLTRGAWKVHWALLPFHIGMVGCLITAGIVGLVWLGFPSWWGITWLHGAFGALLIVGFLGIAGWYCRDRCFRLAYGRMFFVDGAFLAGISVSGAIICLKVLGILPMEVFGPEGAVHVSLVLAWLLISLFGGGAVRHAVATVVWRVYRRGGLYPRLIADACAKCGRCIKACAVVRKIGPEETPALSLKRSLKELAGGKLSERAKKALAQCILCGSCQRACPYQFYIPLVAKNLARIATR